MKMLHFLILQLYPLHKKYTIAGNCGFGHIFEEILNGKLHFLRSVSLIFIEKYRSLPNKLRMYLTSSAFALSQDFLLFDLLIFY